MDHLIVEFKSKDTSFLFVTGFVSVNCSTIYRWALSDHIQLIGWSVCKRFSVHIWFSWLCCCQRFMFILCWYFIFLKINDFCNSVYLSLHFWDPHTTWFVFGPWQTDWHYSSVQHEKNVTDGCLGHWLYISLYIQYASLWNVNLFNCRNLFSNNYLKYDF